MLLDKNMHTLFAGAKAIIRLLTMKVPIDINCNSTAQSACTKVWCGAKTNPEKQNQLINCCRVRKGGHASIYNIVVIFCDQMELVSEEYKVFSILFLHDIIMNANKQILIQFAFHPFCVESLLVCISVLNPIILKLLSPFVFSSHIDLLVSHKLAQTLQNF